MLQPVQLREGGLLCPPKCRESSGLRSLAPHQPSLLRSSDLLWLDKTSLLLMSDPCFKLLVFSHTFLAVCIPSVLPVCVCAKLLSHVCLFATLWTVARHVPWSMGFSRQGYWSGLPCPSLGDLPDPGIQPSSPALQADSLPSEPPGRPLLSVLWWPKWEGNPKKRIYLYYSWFTLLYST